MLEIRILDGSFDTKGFGLFSFCFAIILLNECFCCCLNDSFGFQGNRTSELCYIFKSKDLIEKFYNTLIRYLLDKGIWNV
jgi:hypothetical protein